MAAQIWDQPREIDRRLAQYFNSTRDQWIEIVKAMVGGRGGCTANNSKAAPGFYAWDNGIYRMRYIFRKEGWINGCEAGVETIVNQELKKQVTVMNADEGTGDKSRSPRNRTPKGAANEKLADLNDQFEMFKRHEIIKPPSDHLPIWYLCTYDNGSTVRAELSRPTKFISSHFVKFDERIFIIQGDEWEKIALTPPADAGPEFEIDVRRK